MFIINHVNQSNAMYITYLSGAISKIYANHYLMRDWLSPNHDYEEAPLWKTRTHRASSSSAYRTPRCTHKASVFFHPRWTKIRLYYSLFL